MRTGKAGVPQGSGWACGPVLRSGVEGDSVAGGSAADGFSEADMDWPSLVAYVPDLLAVSCSGRRACSGWRRWSWATPTSIAYRRASPGSRGGQGASTAGEWWAVG